MSAEYRTIKEDELPKLLQEYFRRHVIAARMILHPRTGEPVIVVGFKNGGDEQAEEPRRVA
jgi:hypothetical protein